MKYARQVEIWKQWDSCVNFGSPRSAWTQRMWEIWQECGGDALLATQKLGEENKKLTTK